MFYFLQNLIQSFRTSIVEFDIDLFYFKKCDHGYLIADTVIKALALSIGGMKEIRSIKHDFIASNLTVKLEITPKARRKLLQNYKFNGGFGKGATGKYIEAKIDNYNCRIGISGWHRMLNICPSIFDRAKYKMKVVEI